MIPGYTINESLKQDPDWQLLRCVRTADNLPVLIRAARSPSPKPHLSAQLESEFGTLKDLCIPGVLKAHDLLDVSGGAALILEDPGGTLLNDILESGKFEVSEFLRTAIQITHVVTEMHRHGIVHTQLRPDVLIRGKNGQGIWISGLEHALTTDGAPGTSPSLASGSRAYMAPEQTGRIDADVDHRTDLYLLGLIFYEMLTGRRPFETEDPLELIHCQLARTPRSPTDVDADIPNTLSNIVKRLLKKRANERYMSANGLLADLEECQKQHRKAGKIDPLTLAKHDRPERFFIPEKLYGRSKETQQLLEAFALVHERGPGLVLVAGYSGVGKTSLIRHIRDPVAKRSGYFVSGKYDQLERSNPYSAILQAFLELVRKILTESDAEIELWRERIIGALGANAQVVIDVIPELELIVGKQPRVPELKPVESQNRFNFFFQKFIAALAHADRPLVLFLDDLQWASIASIRLFQSWVTGTDVAGLLVIGAYRDNEVTATHPLSSVVRELRETSGALTEIDLQPLDVASINHIVRDAFMRSAEESLPLAACVHNKTQGNPFFARAFLRTLYEEGQLYPGSDSRWMWDIDAINALRAAENVVDLMARKIERLPRSARDVLKVAACVGGNIEPQTLATAYGQDVDQTLSHLRPAMSGSLIQQRDDGSLSFYHDRVQEAAYGLIPDSDRAPLHYQIGSLLLAHASEEDLDETLFETVNHLNLGATLIDDANERIDLAKLNLRAGLKAKLSTAYGSAHDYFDTGKGLLPAEPWQQCYELAFDMYRECAECAYLCGKFEEAEEGFDLLMDQSRSNREKGVIYNLRMIQYENLSRFPEAAALGREAVALFDIEFPDTEEEKLEFIDREIETIQTMLKGRSVSELVNLPLMQDVDVQICMKLLMTMWAPNYISGDIPMTMLIAACMVRLSLEYGNTNESAYGYVTHAINIAARTDDYARAYDFGKLAMSVNKELDDRTARAKVNHMFSCYIGLWRDHIKECFRYSRAGYDAGIESGDFTYGGYSGFHESWHALFSAMPLDRYIEEYSVKLQFLSGYKYQSIGDAHELMLQWGRCLQGATETPGSLNGHGFSEESYVEAYKDVPFFIAFYYVAKLNVAYMMYDYESAVRYAKLAEKVIFGVRGMIWDALLCFNHALALTAVFDSLDANDRDAAIVKLKCLQEKMRIWAENAPQNFGHQYDLIRAEVCRAQGAHLDAQKYYERAIESARNYGFLNIEALASELAGRAFMQRGRQLVAEGYLQEAAQLYARWGADGKVVQMSQEFSETIDDLQRRAAGEAEQAVASLDVAAILKASQAISGEMIMDQLVERLLCIVLESAGAERGLLLCPDGHDWRVDAAGSVNENDVTLDISIADSNAELWSPGVVNYVCHTSDYLLSADAQQDERLASDSYVRTSGVRSVLCVPILHQQEMSAILYLENNLMPNSFTSERVLIVQALAAQAAIALKNAKLFSDVVKEIGERTQAESALRVIASGTASATGEDFFQSLVQSLSGSLNVKSVFVAECVDPGNLRVRTLALMNNGRLQENIEYDLSGTPCEAVIEQGKTCVFPTNLEELYPIEKGFQSYIGAPALDLSGRILGHLAIMDTSDMSHLPHAESILNIFATRVGVELHRKRMQEDLEASEEKYRLLVDNQTDLVVKLDRNGRLLFVSPSYCEKFSRSERELLDKTFREQVHPADLKRVDKEWEELFVAPSVAQFEHRALTVSGECWLGWALKALRSDSGEILEIVGVGRDVTARRQAEEEARQNLHTLAHAGRLQSMGEMASTMAHELNQPLTAILSFSQASQRVIKNRDYDQNELLFALERIAFNAKRAGDIISHMRGFIRKEEPRAELSDINRLIRDATELVNSELRQLEIDIVLELQETLPAVHVDSIQIQQVILNLVRNSMEAIESDAADERRISLSTHLRNRNEIEVTIADTGPGLNADVGDKIFDAFITTKPEGMGIGLSICQSLIEAHGSELVARQQTGRGAKFSFTLRADIE